MNIQQISKTYPKLVFSWSRLGGFQSSRWCLDAEPAPNMTLFEDGEDIGAMYWDGATKREVLADAGSDLMMRNWGVL